MTVIIYLISNYKYKYSTSSCDVNSQSSSHMIMHATAGVQQDCYEKIFTKPLAVKSVDGATSLVWRYYVAKCEVSVC